MKLIKKYFILTTSGNFPEKYGKWRYYLEILNKEVKLW